jgi:hypothetical protein
MSTAVHNAHGDHINFGDLTPYLIYDIRSRTEDAAPEPDDTNIKRTYPGPRRNIHVDIDVKVGLGTRKV